MRFRSEPNFVVKESVTQEDNHAFLYVYERIKSRMFDRKRIVIL